MLQEVELVGRRVYATVHGLGATSASQLAFVPPTNKSQYKLVGAAVRFHTASSSGTLQVEVAGAAIARGSGTNQLTATMSLSGTADTTVLGTPIAAPTLFGLNGEAVNLIIAGTMTSLADCIVTLEFEKTN